MNRWPRMRRLCGNTPDKGPAFEAWQQLVKNGVTKIWFVQVHSGSRHDKWTYWPEGKAYPIRTYAKREAIELSRICGAARIVRWTDPKRRERQKAIWWSRSRGTYRMSDEVTTTVKAYPCPDCSESFDESKMLGLHRYHAHNYQSDKPEAVARRNASIARKAAKKAAKEAAILARKEAKQKKHAPTPQAPAQEPEGREEDSSIPPQMLAYGIGKLESLAERIADENNLPRKAYLKEVALALAATVS